MDHFVYVVYKDGKPAYCGSNGQLAYGSVEGGNRMIGRMAGIDVDREIWNERIRTGISGTAEERKARMAAEKKRYTVETYVKVVPPESERLAEIKAIIDAIPKSGSKEGRPDYVKVLSCDKVARLRELVTV